MLKTCFIKNQDSYQLTKKSPNIINRPIVARYPNHRWAADLIKMKTYKKYNDDYIEILTVIDYFSILYPRRKSAINILFFPSNCKSVILIHPSLAAKRRMFFPSVSMVPGAS